MQGSNVVSCSEERMFSYDSSAFTRWQTLAWALSNDQKKRHSTYRFEGGAASDSLVFSVGSGGITSSFIAVRESQELEE